MSPAKRIARDSQRVWTKAAKQATLIAVIGTLYDTTDCFKSEKTLSPAEEEFQEFKKELRGLAIDSNTKQSLENHVKNIISRTTFSANEFLENIEVMFDSMENGADKWQAINEAINENLDIRIV